MNPRHDPLSSQFAFHLNCIPHRDDPGLLAFAWVLARATVLAWAAIALLYAVRYAWVDGYRFGPGEVAVFSLCFIVFEEQARWLWLDAAVRPTRAALRFFLYIVVFESVVFYLSATAGPVDFLWLRAGSVLVHAVCGGLALLSVARPVAVRYTLFGLAVAFHALMNLFGTPALVAALD